MKLTLLLVPVLAFAQHFDLTTIAPGTPYSASRGYGYETAATRPPFFFSVRVPEEGNYKVTVTFGNASSGTVTTVRAELRRLMVEEVRTEPGKSATRSFIVNVRRPQIPGGGEVRLKPRETESEAWAWDDKITLEFTNSSPGARQYRYCQSERSHAVHRGRFHIHRPAARTLQQLGTDAASLLQL